MRTAVAWLARTLAAASIAWPCAAHELYAVSYASGELFRVSSLDASLTLVGPSGLAKLAALEFAPDGTLWAIRDGHVPKLVRLDPASGAITLARTIGLPALAEGALAFSPTGSAYLAHDGNTGTPQLFTLDLSSGATALVGSLGAGSDVNGLGWRADGRLLALDRASHSLRVLDPADAATLASFPLGPALGHVGGMALRGGLGYFVTGETGGSRELWRFDPYTGAHALVGALPSLAGAGLSGLAWRVAAGPESYCTVGTTSGACSPSMSATGSASATANSGFTLRATQVDGQRSGLVFYGASGRSALPWGANGSSWLCVQPPLQRTAVQSSGGTALACDGVIALDWNAWRAAHPGALGTPFVVGSVFGAQIWFRDPPASKTTHLTDALEFELWP